MGAGRRPSYNPRTGKWSTPKPWYDKGRKSKNNGCYVATAVYGSYDCPEVWVLRRYRDNHLAKSYLGRAFIHVYYSLSPTFVKLFGKTRWFNILFHSYLDSMVARLKAQGYSSDRYEDVEWY
ncbi:MAG: CFI-box-CTERM domain-containing protein [Faecousia sp.]